MIFRITLVATLSLLLSGCTGHIQFYPSTTPSASSQRTSTPTVTPTPILTPTPVAPVTVPEPVEEPVEPAPPAPPAADQLEDVTPQLLTLNIAGYGDQPEIDACIGWIILTRYQENGIQPTLAEHNTCGGAAILALPIGSRVQLAGAGLDGLYEIVDSRDVPQQGSTLDIQGMAGEILAQSCYFDSEYMRFIGLVKVG